ncbi:MAG TPA: response regulator [Nitrososphaeraceae archaeon]|nr:response regulator [Nitrososphaeraceae archaeon]
MSKTLRHFFIDALRSINGITIFAITDPTSALEHFQKDNDDYEVAISDFTMPRLNGMDLLRKMNDMNKSVRTTLITAFEIEDTIFHDYTKKEIINGYFQKPVRLTNLIEEAIRNYIPYEMQKTYPSQHSH